MSNKTPLVKIITADDYNGIIEVGEDAMIITATQNLKKNNLFGDSKNVLSFADLLNSAKAHINYNNCISSAEARYIIYKIIEKDYRENFVAYSKICGELEDLFTLLLLNNISEANINKVNIAKNYSIIEEIIFGIYIKFYHQIRERGLKLLKEELIEEAIKTINIYKEIVFVGFVFFNDLQEAFIRKLNCESIIFVNKRDRLIVDQLLAPLINKMGYQYSIEDIHNPEDNIFSEIERCIFTGRKLDYDLNKQITIYKPFASREEEFIFIAKDLSDKIKNAFVKKEQIQDVLNKFSIVITKNKNELVKILNDAFGQYGVFIPVQGGLTNIKDVYYSKDEFLNDEICDGERKLSYEEKVNLFENCKRIKASGTVKQYKDFPIWRFIFEVYKVVLSDLSTSSLKTLMSIHCYFNKVANNVVMQGYERLQSCFENINSIKDWKITINKMIDLKLEIMDEKNFEKHPLYVVQSSSLIFIKDYINFIEMLTNSLKKDGNLKEHIKILMTTFHIKDADLNSIEEREALASISALLSGLESNENIKIEYKYFAEHIQELLEQYLSYEEKDNKNFVIPVVNMENYTKFEYVYFPMFEDNKYPRILNLSFPYTQNIINILDDLKIGIQKNYDLDYHIKMSRHIFKNVFGFAKEHLYFTYIDKENGNNLGVSTYYDDINKLSNVGVTFSSATNIQKLNRGRANQRKIIFKDLNLKKIYLNQLLLKYICSKQLHYIVKENNKISYKDRFLLSFYAKALVFNRFFRNLINHEAGISLKSKEFEIEKDEIFQKSFDQIIKYFFFLQKNEKKDIKFTSRKQVDDFIIQHFLTGKFSTTYAKFSLGEQNCVTGSFDVITRNNLKIEYKNGKVIEFDISKNLDFLISSSGGRKYDFQHFAELVHQLDFHYRTDDRMAMVNYMSFKINAQLNNAKYREDGINRIKSLIKSTDMYYGNMMYTPSSYCTYCSLKSICKGDKCDE